MLSGDNRPRSIQPGNRVEPIKKTGPALLKSEGSSRDSPVFRFPATGFYMSIAMRFLFAMRRSYHQTRTGLAMNMEL